MMRTALVLTTALLLGACGTTPERLSTVDAGGGITHIKPREPARYVARQPGLAVPGADFLFVSPVAVSRRGVLKHYLWLGARSTVDRKLTGARTHAIDEIVIMIGDKPMRLDIEPWSEASETEAFETGLILTATYAARVTKSQLDRLVESSPQEIIVIDERGREIRYRSRELTADVYDAF